MKKHARLIRPENKCKVFKFLIRNQVFIKQKRKKLIEIKQDFTCIVFMFFLNNPAIINSYLSFITSQALKRNQ